MLINKMKKNWNYLITLRYTKLFSYSSAKCLASKLNQSHKYRYVYYYGFQVIYGAINKFLLLILLGLLFNILPQIIIVSISFVSLRVWIGGLHYDSYTKCAYTSLTTFLIMGLLAKYVYLDQIADIMIFLFVFIVIILYAPVENKNRPIKPNEKSKFKIISFCILITLFTICTLIDNTLIKNSITYGVLLSGIIATPIVNKVEKL